MKNQMIYLILKITLIAANPTLTAANLYLNGFTISQEGTIDIPNVGEDFCLKPNSRRS